MGLLDYFASRTARRVRPARCGSLASGRRTRFEPLEQRTMLSVVSLAAVEDGSPDTFEVSRAGDMLEITINGTLHEHNVAEVTELVLTGSSDEDTLTVNSLGDYTGTVVFNANGGNDVVNIYDTAGDDLFEATPTHCEMVMEGAYSVEANDAETMNGYATDGMDVANWTGAAGSHDRFTGKTGFSQLEGTNYRVWGRRFEQVTATGQDDTDLAKLYDGPGDDSLVADPTAAKIKYNGGETNFVEAIGFRYAHSYATHTDAETGEDTGNDTAYMQDAADTADRLKCGGDYGVLFGPGFLIKATHFEQLIVTATPGQADIAKLYDRSGDDLLEGTPTATKLTFDGDPATFIEAIGFRYAHGVATSGGNDTATLQDAAATADRFKGAADQSKLYSNDFFLRAKGFDQVVATATSGQGDVATLYDGAGADIFTASPTSAKMSYNGSATHFTQADGFRYVHGLAYETDTQGAVDKAYLTDSAGDDILKAYADYTKLYNNTVGFYSRARLFDEVHATGGGTGQDDYAYLYDSAGDDHLEYGGATAKVSSTDLVTYLNEADQFKHIRPISPLNNGTDTKTANAMDAGYDMEDTGWL